MRTRRQSTRKDFPRRRVSAGQIAAVRTAAGETVARPLSPASSFRSDRGYHLTRRSSRRTDGRQRSDGEAPRPSATDEGRLRRRSGRRA